MKKTITLPGTELQVSPVCLGGAWFGEPDKEARAMEVLDAYYAAGGRFVDTANVYCRWIEPEENRSEQVIGKWLKSRGITDMTVATKGGHYDMATGRRRVWREDVAFDIDSSLRALQTDHLDLYYLHRDDENQPIGQILEMMNDFVREGKLRYLAASNFSVQRLQEADEYARLHGLQSFCAASNQHSLAMPNVGANVNPDPTLVICGEKELAYHEKSGKTLIPYQSTANGYFAKKAAGREEKLKAAFDNAKNEKTFAELQKKAAETGETMQLLTITELVHSAKNYLLLPIVGANTVERVADLERAMELLTPSLLL